MKIIGAGLLPAIVGALIGGLFVLIATFLQANPQLIRFKPKPPIEAVQLRFETVGGVPPENSTMRLRVSDCQNQEYFYESLAVDPSSRNFERSYSFTEPRPKSDQCHELTLRLEIGTDTGNSWNWSFRLRGTVTIEGKKTEVIPESTHWLSDNLYSIPIRFYCSGS